MALLGENSASELWDAVEAADPANVDEWLRGQNDPSTPSKFQHRTESCHAKLMSIFTPAKAILMD